MNKLNNLGKKLIDGLVGAKNADDQEARALASAEKVNVVGAGGVLTAAYEQLRNAAENTEEHLLLQNAIRRFYKQLFVERDENLIKNSGHELATELTLAGYVPNDRFSKPQIEQISKTAVQHYKAYETAVSSRAVSADKTFTWTLDTLSTKVEGLVNSHSKDAVFTDLAYSYFEKLIPQEVIALKQADKDKYGGAIFLAIHRGLLKSNTALMRTSLLERYKVDVTNLESYISFNEKIDEMINSELTDKIYHIVDRNGAPLRVLRRMIESREDLSDILSKREVFLQAFEQQVGREYEDIGRRINRAIVKSVIFLIITKFAIGVAVEVPYDFWAHGEIIWLPLIINLLFPPVYMVALRLTHQLPGYSNTTALVDRIDNMLYGEIGSLSRRQITGGNYSAIFKIIYAVSGILVFTGVTWLLLMLQFSIVHIVIFFVFLSAASFLGFRLSRMIRELEVIRSSSNGFTFVRDLVYLPFVIVGRWMSDKYSQVNIIALVLDMIIELPLKTVLRLVRQWGAFMDERKDNIA